MFSEQSRRKCLENSELELKKQEWRRDHCDIDFYTFLLKMHSVLKNNIFMVSCFSQCLEFQAALSHFTGVCFATRFLFL